MTARERVIAVPARLRLGGHEPVSAHADVVYRPRSLRIQRALLSLLGFWALIPVVVFIPPHLPWALTAFAVGIYFGWTNWRGVFEIRALEAPCPRCGKPLTVKPGSKIGTEHKISCYTCHHEPRLEMGRVPE